ALLVVRVVLLRAAEILSVLGVLDETGDRDDDRLVHAVAHHHAFAHLGASAGGLSLGACCVHKFLTSICLTPRAASARRGSRTSARARGSASARGCGATARADPSPDGSAAS